MKKILLSLFILGFLVVGSQANAFSLKDAVSLRIQSLNNEIIKQRLSCIPIHIKDAQDFPSKNYIMEVNMENTTDTLMFVTTENFTIKDLVSGKLLPETKVREIFPADDYTGYFIDFLRLRPKISDEIPGEKIHLTCEFDVGTNKCMSALALSYNKLNKVKTFDIVKLLPENPEVENIEYILSDSTEDSDLINCPIIFLDVDHDGLYEDIFYDYLKSINWKGILILDDIHINDPMKNFWDRIEEKKYDITNIGHWSGTGLVIFE